MDDNERKQDSALNPASSESAPDSIREAPESAGPSTEPGTAPREIGGRKGPDPVRYGDWEKNGRCIDF